MKVYDHSEGIFGDIRAGSVVRLLNGRFDSTYRRVPRRLRIALKEALRKRVDQWIDSGRGADGVDVAPARNVYWRPTDGAKPLRDVLVAWNHRHAAELDVLSTGERVITMGKPKKADTDILGLYWPMPENEWEAAEIATYWLQQLLDSPDSYRVARCDNPSCRAPYYIRERARKTETKMGTYCRDCRSAGAIARVTASRDRRKQQRLNLAVDVWDGFKPSRNHPKKSDWVAAQVNKKLLPDMWIQGKWVTQNRRAIEIEAESRKHPRDYRREISSPVQDSEVKAHTQRYRSGVLGRAAERARRVGVTVQVVESD